jgi:arylsulfatase A-like enzyme
VFHACAASGLPDASRMNILFINIEDCNAAALGCYGNPICRTPNLERLCASGVRFDAAYVQAIACNPSRSSFLTGLRPRTTGITSNGHVMDPLLPPGTLTLPEILKAGGFHLTDVGKLFHKLEYAEKRYAAFDRLEFYQKPAGWSGPEPLLKFPAVKNPVRDPAPKDEKSHEYREWKARHSDRYGDSGLDYEEHGDYRMAVTAAAALRDYAKSGRRFFLSVSQSRPHTPLTAPKKFLDLYDPARIPDPAAPAASLKNFPYMKRATGGNPDIFMKAQPTPQQAREAIAAYYACCTMVDANIGLMLDALDETGLAKNTIVVFLGDHGFHLGDHGFWSKYSMLAATHRAPLIVRVPGAAGNGKPCPGIVEFVDFVPTLCELAGVKVPAGLEGVSFAPLFADPGRPWKKAAFISEGDTEDGDGVRTATYSYLEFKKGEMPAALFDLSKDPWETVNVIGDPAYAAARAEMAALLKAGWRAALPDGAR